MSDVWRFNVSGTLSPNLPKNVIGSWEKLSLQNTSLPAIGGSATAAILQTPNQYVAAVGGCAVSSGPDAACAETSSYVLNVDAANDQAISSCPAPRVGASLTPNLSGASSSFGQQAFLLLGTFNSSVWQDDGGLDNGEVVSLRPSYELNLTTILLGRPQHHYRRMGPHSTCWRSV